MRSNLNRQTYLRTETTDGRHIRQIHDFPQTEEIAEQAVQSHFRRNAYRGCQIQVEKQLVIRKCQQSRHGRGRFSEFLKIAEIPSTDGEAQADFFRKDEISSEMQTCLIRDGSA